MHHRIILWGSLTAATLLAVALGAAFALFGSGTDSSGPRSAFAAAPSGNYALVTAPESETADAIYAVSAEDPADAFHVATIDKLAGYRLMGAASPVGTRLALLVPDSGTPSAASATLVVVSLETGEVTRLTRGLDPLQEPVWSPDGEQVYVMRRNGSEGDAKVSLWSIAADGSGETEIVSPRPAFGIYPIGTNSDGTVVSVLLDSGSTLLVGSEPTTSLSEGFTRDWSLSTDGTTVAYIEDTLGEDGVRYVPRVAAVTAEGETTYTARAQVASDGEALGTAWSPQGDAAFGYEPGDESGDGPRAQVASSGFDVPLAYSADGSALAVEHYDGPTFEEPGTRRLTIASGSERVDISQYTAFLGWVAR